MAALQKENIACAVYYPVPLHRQNVFKADCADVSLPVTEAVADRCMSLPIYPELEEADIRRIVAVIRAALNG